MGMNNKKLSTVHSHNEIRCLHGDIHTNWPGYLKSWNLSKSPIHFRYRQKILISRVYEQFSRNESAMAPEKNFKLLKYEHIIYSFEARNLQILNM